MLELEYEQGRVGMEAVLVVASLSTCRSKCYGRRIVACTQVKHSGLDQSSSLPQGLDEGSSLA